MKIESLSYKKEWLPIIASWYVNEWGNPSDVDAIKEEIAKLSTYLNEDKLPLIMVAHENEELLGVAQLKEYEMNIYPEYKNWLGGVFVSKQHRNKGVAKFLIAKLIEKARELKIDKLYLQTENLNGGLYISLGWKQLVKVKYKDVFVLVMENEINSKN